MEAGIEHFGRGVETSIDSVLIVVEPSLDSLELAEKITRLAIEVGIDKVSAVLNKVTSESLAWRLKDELSKAEVSTIGFIYYQPEIFQASLDGLPICKSKVPEEIGKIVDSLLGLEPC